MNSGQLLSTWPASMLRLQDGETTTWAECGFIRTCNFRIYGMIVAFSTFRMRIDFYVIYIYETVI